MGVLAWFEPQCQPRPTDVVALMMRTLIDASADLQLKNDGKTPYDYAKSDSGSAKEVLEILEGNVFLVQLSKSIDAEGGVTIQCASVAGEELATIDIEGEAKVHEVR